MADEIDLAQEKIEGSLALALAMINTKPEVEPTGLCVMCGDDVGPSVRFCSVLCRNDYDSKKKRGLV